MKWAAMLRGINLGKHQIKKDELIAAAADAGFPGARTLLASGNLVFEAGDAKAEAIEAALHKAVEARTGIKSEVFVRNAADLARAIKANPFADAAEERPSYLVVVFCGETVPEAELERVREGYDGPERLGAKGSEMFIDYPDGQARSNLDPAMKKLKVKLPSGTARNWNTVNKLAAMLAD